MINLEIQNLIDTGRAWLLEGSVGRECFRALEAGEAILGPVPHRDYWGAVVPAWWQVEAGSLGSPEYAGIPRPLEPTEAAKREACIAATAGRG